MDDMMGSASHSARDILCAGTYYKVKMYINTIFLLQ